MAKAKTNEEIANVPTPGTQALSEVDAETLAFLGDHAGEGAENITNNEIRFPAFRLAQAMSPQVKKLDPKYIEGLSEGDLFNSLTGQIYDKPVKVVILAFLGTQYNISDDSGKILERDIKPTDPRTQWTPDPKDKTKNIKPEADRWYHYAVYLLETQEVATLSLKNKMTETVGKEINGIIRQNLVIGGRIIQNPPAYARVFEIGSAMEKNAENQSWAVFTKKNAGLTPTPAMQACAAVLGAFKDRLKDVVVDVADEREPGSDDGDGTQFPTDM